MTTASAWRRGPTARGMQIPPSAGPSTHADFERAGQILAEAMALSPDAIARFLWIEFCNCNSLGVREELVLAMGSVLAASKRVVPLSAHISLVIGDSDLPVEAVNAVVAVACAQSNADAVALFEDRHQASLHESFKAKMRAGLVHAVRTAIRIGRPESAR